LEQKKRAKFNIVDVIILALILAAAGIFVWQYAIRPGSPADNSRVTYPFVMILDNNDIPNENFDNGKIAVDDIVIDRQSGAAVGKIVSIEVKQTRHHNITSEGVWVPAPKPNNSHLIITVEGRGFRPRDGGLMVEGNLLHNNRGFEVAIRDTFFWFRVASFSLEDGQ